MPEHDCLEPASAEDAKPGRAGRGGQSEESTFDYEESSHEQPEHLSLARAKESLTRMVQETPLICSAERSANLIQETHLLIIGQPADQHKGLFEHLAELRRERTEQARPLERALIARRLAEELMAEEPPAATPPKSTPPVPEVRVVRPPRPAHTRTAR